ncbi:Glucosamine-6-phosphate deaminase 1 [Pseudobythopirellula maris]|uniref:Glucosamine-6-phosphate deaminase n=2 Tax=Pseudobythopirellula maris TaxID=2527991 RepID=A0A5C5ZJ31_9BACT|nr:Glucosamine-6-phosphate deaminase 1 [Pseudobythopirellula maris]
MLTESLPMSHNCAVDGVEKIPCRVFCHASDASRAIAGQIAALIRGRAGEGRTCVLGLATGSTPTGVYDELVRMHREEGLSFQNVVTFNLDEYFPIRPEELQSYVRFMREHLFDHVDIKPENAHVPDGTVSGESVADYCRRYEEMIEDAGGIDLQLLGIGRTGHIGFNEPGSGRSSRTRLITLDRVTRRDAASDFFGEENVPARAITMGVGTILAARQLVLMAWGEGKASIIAQAVEGEISTHVAASFLQEHPNAQIVMDEAAAEHLTRRREPWALGPVDWDDTMIRKAVIWLAKKLDKPLLKLTSEDYNEEGLQDLLANCGPVDSLNLRVFRHLQGTITGWPAGKPDHAKQPGDRSQPGDHIFPKRVLIFSPHPDDDVISMGGTLIRLVDQGHELHVAYQTSGNIAVFDDDAIRFSEFVGEFNRRFGVDPERTAQLEAHVDEFLKQKSPGQVDSEEVQFIKGVIRRTEARAATRCCGVPAERLHFMDMPFYETGRVRKKPLGEEDIRITVDLLREIRPHQVYAAGDLSDPHGTHRTCLAAVLRACKEVENDDWFEDCQVWLYRGAWQEWGPHQIEVAVPLSPQELLRKRVAIFKHESQKDRALFPGPDPREFWQRAEDRNHGTAQLYDKLGLAEYEGIEGFVRWKGEML